MRKENIIEMIDKKIIESFINGISIYSIQEYLEDKIIFMSDFIEKQGIDLEELINIDFDVLSTEDFKDKKLVSSRNRYTAFYIKHSRKRLLDLYWIIDNHKKFPHLSKSQVFKLVKLKEKLRSNI